jgi:4-amino-4-deoxy-L-arabinose transferase-like glycosyltransferase
MLSDRLTYVLLALIIAGFIATGVLYAVNTPPWQAPDEPAHYNYMAQIATGGCCPVLVPGDWDSPSLEQLKAEQFPDGADLTAIQYEDHQPPLYYLAGALVFLLSGGRLTALRLVSVACGAGVVLAAYFAVARLLPRHRLMALAAAAFVAFVPQHVAIMASVNNDSLAELVLGILSVVAITFVGNPTWIDREGTRAPLDEVRRPHAAALGGLVGVAFLTKLTIYLPAVLLVAAAILARWRLERRSVQWLGWQVAWSAGLAVALGSIWWVRNITVYGWPDFLGQAAHSAVVVGQLRTADLVGEIGLGTYLERFAVTTYHSFWGQFGWMGVPMPPRIYLLIGLFMAFVAIGLALLLASLRGGPRLHAAQRAGAWILAVVAAATLFNYIVYNLTFVQLQGRYLFTALIPAALLMAGGLQGWAMLLARRLRSARLERALAWAPLIGLAWMPVLAVVALYRYVIPFLG